MQHLSRTLENRIAHGLSALATAVCFAGALPASAQLVIFEDPGITLGDDPVECSDQTTYRYCESLLGSERILSHDGLDPADRIPLDFHLFLPPEPVSGPDGNYPLVVFIHGWSNDRYAPGGGLQSEFVPYAEAGYAVLAYSARAWGGSCGSSQQFNPECADQWNHLADSRYEVGDTQYLVGLLVDELSDTGTPLIDAQKIGVTGVSYGGSQSAQLATLRNRVVDPDGSLHPWVSPLGTPLEIAAAAPFWAWTDLAYSLMPNGRSLDYVVNDSYRGPGGSEPIGVAKTTYIAGLYALGQTLSVFAPPTEDPDINTWKAQIDAGEPYLEATVGEIATQVTAFRSAFYRLDGAVEPPPTLFNSGWSDDLFPMIEPLRWIHRAKHLHPGMTAMLVASDYGHARARGDGAANGDFAYAKSTAREWFDHYLMGIGPAPGPGVRARTQFCPGGTPAVLHSAPTWKGISAGEVRLQQAAGGTVLSSAGPSSASVNAFDPIAGSGACARVSDQLVAGSVVVDFPPPPPGGYTLMGSPTIIADLTQLGSLPADAILAARLLDIDASGTEQLLSRGVYRPDASGQQVFQLSAIGHHVADGHHLQLEFLGHEAPTHRQSNFSFTIDLANLDLRIPVAEAPDGGQIQAAAPDLVPPGYLPEPGRWLSLAAGILALVALRRRR